MDIRPAPDTDAMVHALNVLFEPTDIIELRAFAKGRKRTDAGYFDPDHRQELVAHAARLNSNGAAVYVNLNPIDPQLLGRYCNRVQEYADATATDANVICRRWLLVDLDPKRPKNTAATAEQVGKSKALAGDVYTFLRESGWPAPIVAESGNGFHLLYPLNLPNDDAARDLIKGALIGLAAKFDTSDVQVDTAVFNAARITKLYGTVATKGDHTEIAPWRLSQMVKVPGRDAVVTPEQLQALHVVKQPGQHATHASQPYTGRFSLPDFLTRLGIDYEHDRHDGRDRYKLEHCPFNAEHGKGEAAIFQNANGALGFKCQHNTCAGHGWQDVRALLDGPKETRQPPAMDFPGLTAGKGQGSAPQADTPRYSLADMSAARLFAGPPPPVQWLIQDIMPLGKLAVVASPPGVGKSYLLADLACKVASTSLAAYAMGGAVAAKGRAIYVSAEDDLPELHRRIHALTDGNPPQRLYCLSLPDTGGCFSVMQAADRLTRETAVSPQWAELARQIEAMDGVKLVIVDTLQAMSQGNTNDASEVQPMMNELSRLSAVTGATVVLVHHVGKGSTREIRTALDASEAVRGSGAITGAARSVYTLWPAPETKAIEICEALNVPYAENKVIFGMVAKANAKAYQGRTVFVRTDNGVLADRTAQLGHILGGQRQTDRVNLLGAITKAARQGKPFAASHSQAGLHSRRDEIGKEFINRSRDWFASMTAELLAEGVIQRKPKGAGFVLVPPDSDADSSQANDEQAA